METIALFVLLYKYAAQLILQKLESKANGFPISPSFFLISVLRVKHLDRVRAIAGFMPNAVAIIIQFLYTGSLAGFMPHAVAIIIQFLYTGSFLLCSASFGKKHLSPHVFAFYRQATASALLVLISFIFERRRFPQLTFAVALKLFFHALLGMTGTLNTSIIGLKYTSASVVSTAANSVPEFAFFWSLLLRKETMKLKSLLGIGKALGAALCLTGVALLILYRGRSLNLHGHSVPKTSAQDHASSSTSTATWIMGSFFVFCSNLAWSLRLVLQEKITRDYPSKLLLTTFETVSSTAQCSVVAIAFERDMSKWKLHFDISLFAIFYGGSMISGVAFYLQSWCVEKKGPVFAATFTPLSLILTMICSSIFFGETIYLGSVIGALLMVGGLGVFLWGKSKEAAEAPLEALDKDAGAQQPAES